MPSLCANGIAVPDPKDNFPLVGDCEVLLAIRDKWDVVGTLKGWNPETPITEWQGIAISDSGVTHLELPGPFMSVGLIPPELSQLPELRKIKSVQ